MRRRGLGLLLTKLGHDLARSYQTVLSEPYPEPLLALAAGLDKGRAKVCVFQTRARLTQRPG